MTGVQTCALPIWLLSAWNQISMHGTHHSPERVAADSELHAAKCAFADITAELDRFKHDVRGDHTMLGIGWQRFTCYGPNCQAATVLRMAWMSRHKWMQVKAKFLTEHGNPHEPDIKGVRE